MSQCTPLDWTGSTPLALEGLGVSHMTYASGRTGASVSPWGGLHQLAYYGIGPESAPPILFEADASSSYARLFRFQLCVDGPAYNLDLHDTHHYPFGYSSRFALCEQGVLVAHHLTLANDAVYMTVDVLKNTNQIPLVLQLEHHCYTQIDRAGAIVRSWREWESDSELGALVTAADDRWSDSGWAEALRQTQQSAEDVGLAPRTAGERAGTTFIAVVAEDALALSIECGRMLVKLGPFTTGTHAVAIMFASSRNELARRVIGVRKALPVKATEMEAAYIARVEAAPTMCLRRPILSSYFAQSPGISETLVVEDAPGAMRAASMHYWVWGWDTVMCAEAYLVSGNDSFVRDALRFYRETADSDCGWGHQFTRDLKVRIPQAPSAQCLYIIMLLAYYTYTHDLDLVRDAYPFAQQVFGLARKSLNKNGLGTGPALWPDLPVYAGHTGRDCSVFNNSILYQGARSMETLAHLCGDPQTAEGARALSRNLEEQFEPTFWDVSRNYFADSVDALTLEQRKSYPSHAVLWQSPYTSDLVHSRLGVCAKFIREHHATPRGFLPYPRWDKAFNADRNQLGQTWPITDVFDTMCMSAAGDQEMLSMWLDGVEWFWSQLTVPEAYSVQTVNDSGTPDAPGGKQPFSAKSWYMALLQSIGGISFDFGGLTLGPGLERAVDFGGLRFRGGAIDVAASGVGHYPELLTVDGIPVVGSCKIPEPMVAAKLASGDTVRVAFKRTNKLPEHPVILSMHGGVLGDVRVDATGTLIAEIICDHDVWIRFAASDQPYVTANGAPLDCEYDASAREGKVLARGSGRVPFRLTICCGLFDSLYKAIG